LRRGFARGGGRRGLRLTARRRLDQSTAAHDLLLFQLRHCGLSAFETEYRFAQEANGRQWRWDIAFLEPRLAVEVDGGIWVKGAHGHPTTILRNMEKRNWGARLGWRVVCFTPDEIENGQALAFIEACLRSR